MITSPNKSKVAPMKDKGTKRKSTWLSFLYVGVTDDVFSDGARRVLITSLFATVGIVVTLPMSIFALLNGDVALGVFLIAIAVLCVANHIYLRYTYNYSASGYFVIYPLYGLMLYLVYTGGINGTGHVWIFCVPVVALFLHGMKQGLIELGIFTLALIFIMFFMDSYFAESDDYGLLKFRILFSFWV